MEQHPIPQQISSYQFRLVGDMTLKQFFQLAGGILVGLLFYSSPLLPIIKWPFAIVSAILGVALAFVPLEERPLEKWIFAFFRAIYAPTLYYWKKTTTPEKFFQDEAVVNPQEGAKQEAVLQAYLGKTAQKGGALEKLEEAENGFLSKLTGIFSGITSSLSGSATPSVSTPSVGTSQAVPSAQPAAMKIPVSEPLKIVQEVKPKLVIEERKMDAPLTQSFSSSQVNPVIAGNEFISTHQAIFSPMAAPPNPPSIPNIAVGQVIDQERKIVEGAIMEIRDTSGRPVRALRSNKLGHFVIVTPLENGKYEIVSDKEGFEFTPVSFEATGQIIPPILVSGKNLHPEIL
jgi:hypothetical protein